jgi:hypothetical protein
LPGEFERQRFSVEHVLAGQLLALNVAANGLQTRYIPTFCQWSPSKKIIDNARIELTTLAQLGHKHS